MSFLRFELSPLATAGRGRRRVRTPCPRSRSGRGVDARCIPATHAETFRVSLTLAAAGRDRIALRRRCPSYGNQLALVTGRTAPGDSDNALASASRFITSRTDFRSSDLTIAPRSAASSASPSKGGYPGPCDRGTRIKAPAESSRAVQRKVIATAGADHLGKKLLASESRACSCCWRDSVHITRCPRLGANAIA